MLVTVRLFATLRAEMVSTKLYEYYSEETVAKLVEKLKISEAEKLVVVINGRPVSLQQRLTDGDDISIFPLLDGG
jgi:molybdopterin converting factor small subunit